MVTRGQKAVEAVVITGITEDIIGQKVAAVAGEVDLIITGVVLDKIISNLKQYEFHVFYKNI